jgi:hypothetical protein
MNLRSLNLMNNQIDDIILAQIRYFVKNDYDSDSLSTSAVFQPQNSMKAPLATPEPSEYSYVNYDRFNSKESKQKNQTTKFTPKYTPNLNNNSTNHYDNNNNLLLTKKNNSPLHVTKKKDLDRYSFINTNLNDIEIHRKDQERLDQYFKNAENIKNKIDHDPYLLERSLERDFDTLLRYEKKFIQNKNEMTGEIGTGITNNKKNNNINNDDSNINNDGELIQPFDDLRFKNHNVLPFNLNN